MDSVESPHVPPWKTTGLWVAQEVSWGIALVLSVFTAAMAVSFAAHERRDGLAPRATLVLVLGLHAAFLVYTSIRERRQLAAWLAPSLRSTLLGLMGGVAMVASGAGYSGILRWLGIAAPDTAEQLRAIVPSEALLLGWGAVLVPVTEELFFRGRLLDGIRSRAGERWGFVASAVAFAAAHGILVLTPAYLAFAALLWFLRRRTGGLYASIVAHALNNLVGLLF